LNCFRSQSSHDDRGERRKSKERGKKEVREREERLERRERVREIEQEGVGQQDVVKDEERAAVEFELRYSASIKISVITSSCPRSGFKASNSKYSFQVTSTTLQFQASLT
jgi:hypothetical protein